MGFLLTGMVLALLALLMDCGPVYPYLWALGVEPATYVRVLLHIAGLLVFLSLPYEVLSWRLRRRGAAR
ncbi:hypothetical protein FHX63_003051 [Cupriavidus plantarum]|nr:hypothetical protein [Cupriavidus plantarum]